MQLDIGMAVGGAIKLLLAAGLTEKQVAEHIKAARNSLRDTKLRAYVVCEFAIYLLFSRLRALRAHLPA